PADVLRGDGAITRHAQLAAEIEQLVLDVDEDVTHLIRQGLGQHQADAGVELIDRAIGLDAGIVLGDTRAVAKPRAAVIAGAGVDLAQPMSHAVTPLSASSAVSDSSCVPRCCIPPPSGKAGR